LVANIKIYHKILHDSFYIIIKLAKNINNLYLGRIDTILFALFILQKFQKIIC